MVRVWRRGGFHVLVVHVLLVGEAGAVEGRHAFGAARVGIGGGCSTGVGGGGCAAAERGFGD